MTVIARARVVLEGDTIRLTAALRGAEAAMARSGRRMQAIGKSLSTKVTLPILAVGLGAAKAFGDFDSAMVQSQAIMGDLTDALKNDMVKAAEEVARTTTFSGAQAAKSFFFLASAGLTAEQSIAALPQVAKFAQAGMFDMATATDLATDAQSALGLTVDDAQQNLVNLTRVTDVLVKANTLANATVSQFSEALTREAGAALKTFSIDIEEGVAVLAAFADQGVKSQLAGTGLSRILRLLTSAAVNNKEEMRELGITVFDTEGKIRNLADIIQDLEVGLGKLSDEERTAALESIGFSARIQGIILPLLGTSAAVREYEAGLRTAGGTTQEITDKQLKAFSAQLKITWNNIVLAAKALGEALAPAITRVSGKIRAFAIGIAESDLKTRRLILIVAGLVAGLGPLVLVLGVLLKLIAALKIGAITLAFIGWGRAVIGLVQTLGALNAVLVLLQAALGPVGWVILGISAIVGLVALWAKRTRDVGAALVETQKRLASFRVEVLKFSRLDLTREFERLSDSQIVTVQRLKELREELAEVKLRMSKTSDASGAFRRHQNELEATIAKLSGQLDAESDRLGVVTDRIRALDEEDALLEAGLAKLGKTLNSVVFDIDAVKEAMESLRAVQQSLSTLSAAFGGDFNAVEEEASALRSTIEELALAGATFNTVVDEQGTTLIDLISRWSTLQSELDGFEKLTLDASNRAAELQTILNKLVKPIDVFQAQLKRLQSFLAEAEISQEQFNQAVADAQKVFAESTESAKQWGDEFKQILAGVLGNFLAFIGDSGSSFKDFIDGMLRDLKRFSNKLIISGIFKALNVEIPGLSHGGFLKGGRLGLVGERGPELIQAGRTGLTVAPLRSQAATTTMSEPGATVNLTIQAVDARSFADLLEANPAAITAPLLRALGRSRALSGGGRI